MIHFNISIWRKGCVNENKLEFIVKERKLGSNESWNTRTMQHGGPVGSWRRRKTNWRDLYTHDILQSFLFTWFTNIYLIFPGFFPQGFSFAKSRSESVCRCGIEQISSHRLHIWRNIYERLTSSEKKGKITDRCLWFKAFEVRRLYIWFGTRIFWILNAILTPGLLNNLVPLTGTTQIWKQTINLKATLLK